MKREIDLKLTPEETATAIWNLGSDEQAEMFEHLLAEAGSEHLLMLQFMAARDDCEDRSPQALAAFQSMFSSAFKYFWNMGAA